MSKKIIIFLMLFAVLCTGCEMLEDLLSDVNGWDLSVCANYPGACWEYYWDNFDKINGW